MENDTVNEGCGKHRKITKKKEQLGKTILQQNFDILLLLIKVRYLEQIIMTAY